MNIFSNYIPNKFATIDEKVTSWMTERIKNKIMEKKTTFKCHTFTMARLPLIIKNYMIL